MKLFQLKQLGCGRAALPFSLSKVGPQPSLYILVRVRSGHNPPPVHYSDEVGPQASHRSKIILGSSGRAPLPSTEENSRSGTLALPLYADILRDPRAVALPLPLNKIRVRAPWPSPFANINLRARAPWPPSFVSILVWVRAP